MTCSIISGIEDVNFDGQSGLIKDFMVKEMCTLVQALRLCTGRTTAHMGSRVIALSFMITH